MPAVYFVERVASSIDEELESMARSSLAAGKEVVKQKTTRC
jgi:hypothetical protein